MSDMNSREGGGGGGVASLFRLFIKYMSEMFSHLVCVCGGGGGRFTFIQQGKIPLFYQR